MGTVLVTSFCSVTSLGLLWALTCRGSCVAVQSSAKPLVTALPKLVQNKIKKVGKEEQSESVCQILSRCKSVSSVIIIIIMDYLWPPIS